MRDFQFPNKQKLILALHAIETPAIGQARDVPCIGDRATALHCLYKILLKFRKFKVKLQADRLLICLSEQFR